MRFLNKRALFCFAMSVVILAFGLYVNSRATLYKTKGKVVRYAESVDSRGKARYYPIFSFHLPQGRRVSIASFRSESVPKYGLEKEVNVVYTLSEANGAVTVSGVEVLDNFLTSTSYFLFSAYGFVVFSVLFSLAGLQRLFSVEP